jgi:uncharacterized repeat protein (TIGR02543 family)
MALMNKYKIRACRKDPIYQALMHDLIALGVVAKDDVDALIGFNLTFYDQDGESAPGTNPYPPKNLPSPVPSADPESFQVEFDLGGASGTAPATQTVVKGKLSTNPGDPTEANYRFIGWSTDGINLWDFSNPITANVKLTAYWQETVVVTFDLNGGTSLQPDPQTVDLGSLVADPGDPTYQSYAFVGWSATDDSSNIWDFATSQADADITLTAQWQAL